LAPPISDEDKEVRMGAVIDMASYQARKAKQAGVRDRMYPRPRVHDADIWTRNWSRLNNVVWASLRMRDILWFHLPYGGEWEVLLLDLLEEAVRREDGDADADLSGPVQSLKEAVTEKISPLNRKDLSLVLLLLDLIQKIDGKSRSGEN
jgi:hypothetical protein